MNDLWFLIFIGKGSREPSPASLGKLADWNIDVAERSVVVHIFDSDYIEDEHLIIGLFHAFLYPTKG
ncbi:hypothetical protein [Paraliobacillus sediminis]|uniref:hypothetical protein n=1 Tax=Paraliobacillus sediminis TaxID=1885916 RepID=UPI0013C32627|nr:hypothetical protein [Paraliobacillus sediminis]